MGKQFERMQVLIEPDVRKEIEELAVAEAEGVTLRMIRTLLREALAARRETVAIRNGFGQDVRTIEMAPGWAKTLASPPRPASGIIDV
jgi:hypothetical protein